MSSRRVEQKPEASLLGGSESDELQFTVVGETAEMASNLYKLFISWLAYWRSWMVIHTQHKKLIENLFISYLCTWRVFLWGHKPVPDMFAGRKKDEQDKHENGSNRVRHSLMISLLLL